MRSPAASFVTGAAVISLVVIVTGMISVGCAKDPHPDWNTYHLGWFIARRAHHVSTTLDAWNQHYQITGYDEHNNVIWFRAEVPSVTVDLGKGR